MAGIVEAEELIANGFTKGLIINEGKLTIADIDTKFLCLHFPATKDTIIQYDYGGDVRFDKGLQIGDTVELVLLDEYTATWRKSKP